MSDPLLGFSGTQNVQWSLIVLYFPLMAFLFSFQGFLPLHSLNILPQSRIQVVILLVHWVSKTKRFNWHYQNTALFGLVVVLNDLLGVIWILMNERKQRPYVKKWIYFCFIHPSIHSFNHSFLVCFLTERLDQKVWKTTDMPCDW